jgi:hypothetical protein
MTPTVGNGKDGWDICRIGQDRFTSASCLEWVGWVTRGVVEPCVKRLYLVEFFVGRCESQGEIPHCVRNDILCVAFELGYTDHVTKQVIFFKLFLS